MGGETGGIFEDVLPFSKGANARVKFPWKEKKVDGALHPDSLLSTWAPTEEVIAPEALASGLCEVRIGAISMADETCCFNYTFQVLMAVVSAVTTL
eukprot:14394423-Ditylum_brightwellii.AAC.1